MFKGFVHFLAITMLSVSGWAQAAEPVSEQTAKTIIESLESARPDLQFTKVKTTPMAGLYHVTVNGSQFLYTSEDGKYVIAGDMFEVRPNYLAPVQDFEKNEERRQALEGLPDNDFLIFPAVDGEPKATVYVFTDIDCGFCRKLHLETVPGLNLAGVEVRYLAFPRAGVDSASYRKIATAWCSEDRNEVLTRLKQQQPVADNVCADNPVAAQYQLGVEMGVAGTPALVLADGTLLPGYRTPEELLNILRISE